MPSHSIATSEAQRHQGLAAWLTTTHHDDRIARIVAWDYSWVGSETIDCNLNRYRGKQDPSF